LKNSPALIGFQEVRERKKSPTKESRYQVEDLAIGLQRLHYHFIYEPAMAFKEGDHEYVHEGLAIFSKYPIIKFDTIKLSRNENDESDFHQRLCLRALILTPFGLINFLTTHLSLSDAARTRTIREIGKYVETLEEPTIIVGDFNMVVTDENNILTNEFGLSDAWIETHPDASPEEGWTFSSWDLKSRIDYVFTKKINVTKIEIVGGDGEPAPGFPPVGGVSDMKNTMFPSDHRFLYGTAVIPK